MSIFKKSFVIVVVIGLVIVNVFLVPWLTRAYPLKPVESKDAPLGADRGLSVSGSPPVISMISDKQVLIVVEPGLPFQQDTLWMVEYPRRDGSKTLKEYRVELPEFRANSKIQPLGMKIPQKVLGQVDRYTNPASN